MVFSLLSSICYAQSAEYHHNKGIEYGVSGEFERAQQEFRKGLEADPFYTALKECLEIAKDVLGGKIQKVIALHLFTGLSYFYKGMYDDAIAAYKEAIKLDPNYARGHLVLGEAYGEKGMYDEAIAEHKRAIEINPRYAAAHNNLGIAYAHKGLYDEAIAAYERAVALAVFPQVHNNLGRAYYYKGMYDEAIAAFEKAIEVEPKHASAYYNLAMVYYEKGEYEVAAQYYNKAVEFGYTETWRTGIKKG